MGWTTEITPREKKLVVAELVVDSVDHRVVGNHVWALYKMALRDDLCIVLYLLRQDKGCWGYKDLDESMGPYYYTCPLKFLERSALNGESAQEWAEKVRDFHAYKKLERAGTIEVGKTYKLRGDDGKIKILYHYKAQKWAARYQCGGTYSVTKRKIDWSVPGERV